MALTAVFSSSVLAQGTQPASATSASSTTIVAPIAISNSIPLAFGSFASNASGTLVLSVAGIQSSTGGVKLTSAKGDPTAAKFTVTGQGAYAYTVTLPTSLTLTTAVAGTLKTMEVTTFVSSLASGIGALASGTQDFTVGATLNVGANQVVGLYQSITPFTVIVNYN
ncbi:DUF4402 domain-containing protein [Flavobacterium sp. LS1P28]|uniref:DUF4402 domain-containing protein n=1 Tax=Flavobacterium sp. LS1P28 TaxID=2497752 RepID=UPI00131571BD|nr:DUF4402 domain-containing protein [Flavobacterium sp. LS1P28]